uniref:Uncharacterized protein n=1 Tax=Anopheles stephensi TaxID=30069 RepID=A0A182Y2G7_ANOST
MPTQALALTRSKSPKKDTSMPVSPSHTTERDTEMSSPKAPSGTAASSSSSSSHSSTACEPAPTDRSAPADVTNGSANHHHLPAPSNGPSGSSSTVNPGAGQSARPELGANLHPAISVSQSLLAAAATVNRSVTPRISVSNSLTAPENNGPGPNGPGTNPANGPHIDRTILQSPVAAVAAAAAAMQDRKQDFDFSKVNG